MLRDVSCVVEHVVPYILKDCSSFIFIDPSKRQHTTHQRTQCHIPEDLNFSNTAVRISDLAINPAFHQFWLLLLCSLLPSGFQKKLNYPVIISILFPILPVIIVVCAETLLLIQEVPGLNLTEVFVSSSRICGPAISNYATTTPFHIFSKSLLYNHSTIWCCIVWATDSLFQ